MFTREELMKMFEKAGAIRHGHFELSSGLHSGTYVQCALVCSTRDLRKSWGKRWPLCSRMRESMQFVSPALGGVIIGQEVARALPAHG